MKTKHLIAPATIGVLGALAVRAALGEFGTDDTIISDLAVPDPDSTDSGDTSAHTPVFADGSTPWYANIVNETMADMERIENGTWTAEDQAREEASLQALKNERMRIENQTRVDDFHNDQKSREYERMAKGRLSHAREMASDAAIDHQHAIHQGSESQIRRAANAAASANNAVDSAAESVRIWKRR